MNKIYVVEILNPLQPEDCIRTERELTPGQSLADMFPPNVLVAPRQFGINGGLIDDENLALTFPSPGDYITVCPIPTGDDGKMILRLVAIIALATFAPELAVYAYEAFGGTFVAANAAAVIGTIQVGVMVAGSMVINALLPPPKPTMPNYSSDAGSPTYGIDGPKNTSAEGLVVPVNYGATRVAGNVVQNFTVNLDGGTQLLYMLLNAGEGPIAGISDIELNDEPISLFPDDVEYKIALGDGEQEVMGWFADGALTPRTINQKITDTWKFETTSGVVERLRFDVAAPNGIFEMGEGGSMTEYSVGVQFEIRKQGTAQWAPVAIASESAGVQTENIYQLTREVTAEGEIGAEVPAGPVIGEYVDSSGNIYHPYDGRIIGVQRIKQIYVTSAMVITGKDRSAIRRSLITPDIPKGVYEIRYVRTAPKSTNIQVVDEVYFAELNEIVTDKVAYRHTALLALKIKVTDRFNSIPKVTFKHGGKLVRVYDEANGGWAPTLRPSDNPAWVTYDILTNKRYGGGVKLSRIPLDRWRDWASWCEANNLTFRGTFDTQSNIWDASNQVARCGRAQVMRAGTRFDLVVERPEVPTMMFSVANMVDGTFKENWLSTADRANEVEVSYADVEDKGRQRTVRVYDKIAFASGQPQRSAAITIKGIDSAERAFQEAQLHLNMNRLLVRTIEFGTTPEALACRVGDVVLVQHDMPQWGYAGRFEAGSTTAAINLDRKVTIKPGKTYSLRTIYPALRRQASSIMSVDIGTRTVGLNGYNGAVYKQMRLKVGVKDLEIEEVVPVSGGYGVIVSDATGLTPGAMAEIFELNAIVTNPVVNNVTGSDLETTQINLSSPLPVAPEQFGHWMFGEVNKVGKPFRIRRISGSNDYRRDIVAIEYNEGVYDTSGTAPELNYSDLGSLVLDPPTVESVTEETVSIAGAWLPRVTIAYRSAQSVYETSEVQVSRGANAWEVVGKHPERVTITSFKGEELRFRVVPFDRWGNRASTVRCPIHTYVVMGLPEAPEAPGSISVSAGEAGLNVSWPEPIESDWINSRVLLGSQFNTANELFSGKATSCTVPWQPAGVLRFWVVHERSGGVASQPASVLLTVSPPNAPVVNAIEESPAVARVTWNETRTTQPLKRHLMRVGTTSQTWNDLSNFSIVSSSARQDRITFGTDGVRRIWVAAEDVVGNLGDPSYSDVSINGASITGQTGAPGTGVATVSLFQWSTVQPQNPAGSALYSWSTASHTSYNGGNGWQLTLPGNPGTPGIRLWEARRTITAPAGTPTTTIDWTSGVSVTAVGANGQDGSAGQSARFAAVAVYQWALTIPTISGSSTYTWNTASLSTPLPSGWSSTAGNSPAPGMTLWRALVNLADANTTATTAVNWVTAAIDAVGYAGQNGSNGNFIDYVFIRSATQPATPTGNGTPAGWSDAPPAGTNPVWMSSAEKTSSNVLLGSWSTPARLTGEEGPAGAAGVAGDSVQVEYSADGTNYHPTFTLGDIYMRQRVGTGPWSGAIRIVGEKGDNGSSGSNGAQGASARTAYAKSTLGTLGTGNVQTVGNSSYPPNGSWGANGWGASMPTLNAGDFGFVTDGIYDPVTNITTWTTPYQAALKVGQLSAISSNLGSINAGQMNIGSGRFVVDPNGYLVARGVRIEDEAGNVIMQTSNAGTSPIPANWVNPASTWLNSNIGVDGSGSIYGIGSGSGTQIANSALVPSINYAATVANWSGVTGAGRPEDNATVGASRANLKVGLGLNVIPNSDFGSGVIAPWSVSYVEHGGSDYALALGSQSAAGASWNPVGSETVSLRRWGNARTGVIDWVVSPGFPVIPGARYELSAYVASHRADTSVMIVWLNEYGNGITANGTANSRMSGGANLANWDRIGVFATAPSNARMAQVRMRAWEVDAGQSDAYYWGTRFHFGEALPSQTELSPWAPAPASNTRQLGYTGDLNATYGANWTSNVAGRPADTAIMNDQIGINASGQFYNAATGQSGITVSNSQLSLSSDGKFLNAGSQQGQVTIGGLGYSGDLDATKGANASNFTGRVGGGNLIGNSGFARYGGPLNQQGSIPTNWSIYNGGGISVSYGVFQGGLFGTNVFRIIANQTTTSALGIHVAANSPDMVVSWTPGEWHVISFWVRAMSNEATGRQMTATPSNMGFTDYIEIESPVTQMGVWKRYIARVRPASNGNTPGGEFYISHNGATPLNAGAIFDICAVQVEQGDVPTNWAVSPREKVGGDNPITQANASTFIANAAIGTAQVGVLTAGNLTVGAVSDTVNGSRVSGGRITMDTAGGNGGRIQIFDNSNNRRIAMGYLL
jgi:predicted phage tail protein